MNEAPVGLKASQKAMTRDRLVAAARECLATQGYLGTTVEDITRAAGATRATFYLHFSSKAEITREVWERFVEEPTEALWAQLGPVLKSLAGDPSVLRRDWFPAVLKHWQQEGAVVRAIWDARVVEPLISERMQATRDHVVGVMIEALSSDSPHSSSALRIRAIAAFEIQTQVFLNWIERRLPREADEVAEALSDAWVALLS